MLKKKRFSGLFGTSVTEIPSPNPEQQSSPPLQPIHSSSGGIVSSAAAAINGGRANVGVSALSNNPRALGNQGRQMSLGNFGNLLTGASSATASSNGGVGGAGTNSSAGEDSQATILTRADIHNSLESLKKLVVAAESYREMASSLAKSTKQLGKCFRDYGETKGMDNTHVMCLMASATFYETFAEMQKKLATTLQKDFELLQTSWEKHSKRISKDEKAHDEILQELDEKIKKISLGYDKKAKKPDPSTALVSHEKYITSLAGLQESIAIANREHRNNIGRRERYTHSLTSQISCRMAEAQFLAIERQLRGSGPSVVKIKEWAPYAALEMPQPTLVSEGEPTIQIQNVSYDEYTAEHTESNSGSTASRVDSGIGSVASSNSTPSGTIVNLSEMPPITLPPFEPMVQQQQQRQQPAHQQQSQQQQQPSSSNLPSTMPDPKNYVVKPSVIQSSQPQLERQATPTVAGPLPTTMPVPRPAPAPVSVPTTNNTSTAKEPVMHARPAISTVVSSSKEKVLVKDDRDSLIRSSGGGIKRIESNSTSSEISPHDSVSVVGLAPPAKTPGAFPESMMTTTTTVTSKESPFAHSGKGDGPSDSKIIDGGNERSDANQTEIQDSRSGPSNTMRDKIEFGGGGSQDRDDLDHMDDMRDGSDGASRAYLGRYTHGDEDDHHESVQRHQMDRDDYDVVLTRDVYATSQQAHSSYSPFTMDNPYYDEDQEMYARLKESARYYDEDESPQSGSGPATGHGEYFTKSRYEPDRAYEYGGIASSAPVGSYTREQYPTMQESYPSRPTLEDRERDLERMNQQKMEGFKAGLAAAAAAAAAVTSTSARPPPSSSNYNSNNGTRRTEPVRASGTVASLRRRFSDLSVSDMSSLPGPVSPTMGPRGGGGYGEDTRRDNRHPPRVFTPQSRAVLNSTSPLPPSSGQYRYGLSKGAASTGNLLNGVGHDRYNRGVEYDDASHRSTAYINDRQRRPVGAGLTARMQ